MVLSKFQVFASRPVVQRVLKMGKTAFSPKYLLYTNILIVGHLAALGDIVQQTYQRCKPENNKPWDYLRTARMFGAGICLSPFKHFWYLKLDKFFPGNSVRTVLIKMVPDTLIFSPTYILMFLAVTGLLEGQSWTTFQKGVESKSLSLYGVELCLGAPTQFLNFYFLPTRFRVLFDNTVSLVSDVFYSYFRFDYKGEDGDETVAKENILEVIVVEKERVQDLSKLSLVKTAGSS